MSHPLPQDVAIADCEPGKHGGIFVLTETTEPKTFNFLVPADSVSGDLQGHIFSGLVDYDPIREEHIPALAKSWEIGKDNLSYTFHLRKGVCWSDGAPFTADDVVFTFDAIFDPRYPSRYVGQYTIGGKPIKYEKLDTHTVHFTTPKIYAPFINDIGFVKIVPKHILKPAYDDGTLLKQWSTKTAIDNPNSIVGTGAFCIESYSPGERVVFVPNPHYWRADRNHQRLPYLDHLIYTFVADAITETFLFTTGQTDAAEIRASDVPWVSKAEGTYDFTLHSRGPSSGIFFIWFNQKSGKNAEGKSYLSEAKARWFGEKRFRQALLHATNRQGLVNSVLFGRGTPLHSIISSANKKWYNSNVKQYDYSVEQARKLLQSAGFSWNPQGLLTDAQGELVSFELLAYEGSPLASGTATTFKDNLREIGIEVKISVIDFSNLLNRIDKTFDYDSAMIGFTGGGDPSGAKALYKSDGHLHMWNSKQSNPATAWEAEVDRLYDLQEGTLDIKKRIQIIHTMQDVFAEELPLLYMVTGNAFSGIRNRWRNVQVPPSSSLLWNLEELWTEDKPK